MYAGAGTSARCVAALLHSLRRLGGRFGFVVRRVDAATLARPAWRTHAALLCMPGGRDVPYVRALRGAAAEQIRSFVRGGGAYFGSCAGAYFACDALQFEAPRVPAVRGRRPLRLLSAMACGPSQAAERFAYATGPEAGEALLELVPHGAQPTRRAYAWRVFNQGGCVLLPPQGRPWRRHEQPWLTTRLGDDSVAPMARQQSVAVAAAYGRGQVLLCGAHPELTDALVTAEGRQVPGTAALADLLGLWLSRGARLPSPPRGRRGCAPRDGLCPNTL